MVDVSIVHETSSEANWNRQTGGQAGRQTGRRAQDYILSQADALTENTFSIFLVSCQIFLRQDGKEKTPQSLPVLISILM